MNHTLLTICKPRLLPLVLACLMAQAASADEAVTIESGVVYGTAGGEELRADVYRPGDAAAPALHRAVLLIHGGGWAEGNRESEVLVNFAKALAEAGFVAVSFDYRLVKDSADQKSIENPYPAAVDDCRQAVQWLRKNAERFDIDPRHIGAGGRSAGGHLSSVLGTTEAAREGEPSTRVQAVVNIFGPADLTQPFPQFKIPLSANQDLSVQELVDRFVGAGDKQRQREASPIFHIDEQTAPTLILHGTEDVLVPVKQARDFHAALQRAGRTSELVIFDGENHGFTPATREKAIARTVAFFKTHLLPEDDGSGSSATDTTVSTRRDKEPVDWMGIFQVHYDNRVRAFREQNQILENVVLVGDSITEGFNVPTYFPGRRVLNRGIGGDVIGNALPESDRRGVLRRIDASVFDCAPSHVFLLIGVNDLNSGRKPDVMEPGYRDLLGRIKAQRPGMPVYVQSLLPTSGAHAARNADILDFNTRLEQLAGEFDYEYVDLHSLMKDERGELKAEFTEDGLHLTAPAYRIWVAEIEKRLGWAD